MVLFSAFGIKLTAQRVTYDLMDSAYYAQGISKKLRTCTKLLSDPLRGGKRRYNFISPGKLYIIGFAIGMQLDLTNSSMHPFAYWFKSCNFQVSCRNHSPGLFHANGENKIDIFFSCRK